MNADGNTKCSMKTPWTDDCAMPFGPYKGRRLRFVPSYHWELLNKCPNLIPEEHFEQCAQYLNTMKWLIMEDVINVGDE